MGAIIAVYARVSFKWVFWLGGRKPVRCKRELQQGLLRVAGSTEKGCKDVRSFSFVVEVITWQVL